MKTVSKKLVAPCVQLIVCVFTLILITQCALIVDADERQITSAENNEIEFDDSASFFYWTPSTVANSSETSVAPSDDVQNDTLTV